MKRRISFIFAFALLCMSSVVAQVASGTCGDNLTWVLTEEGELIVEGTGDMYDYHEEANGINHPWSKWRNQIKTITIGEGVTSIGNTAFRDCVELTSINLNNDLKHIGVEAFRYCGKLTAIDLPESLTSIANSSFFECRGLLSVTIPEGVTSIDFNTFYDCSSLKSLILPSGMTSIGHDAFKACHNLTEIVCKATTPPSISSSTFSSVSREAFVYVPQASSSAYESAEYWSEFTNFRPIGTCGDNLTWRITPEDELIVEGTGAMTDYELHSAPWFSYKDDIKTVTIKPGVTTIGKYAIGDCGNLTTVTIPEGVTSIGLQAFQYCYKLTSVTLSDGLKTIDWGAFAECHELPSIDIPEGVTTIGNYAFTHCFKLSTVTIPESVTSIGIYAFRNTAITSVVIPANISSLSQGTFENCPNLASITCKAETPPSVEHSETFYKVNRSIPVYVPVSAVAAYKGAEGWKEFTNILPMGTFGENLTWMLTAEGELIIEGTGVMPDYTQPWSDYKQSIKTITVGEGITVLGSAAFSGCSKCTEVNLPNSLTDIRYEAFFACSSLPSITLPQNVKNVDRRVFCDCGSLASVTLNEGLETLGSEAFRACGALKSIEIPSSLREIANSFYECAHLVSVTIPEGVQKIASGAFAFCYDMASLTLPASLTSIGGNAFRQCVKLAYIEARATTPPTIEGSDAFTEVDKNVPVYVPASSVEAYKAADYWSLFANIQPMIIASGTCGDNLTWKYIDGGKLLIEGTGEMFDYSNNSAAPWQNYKGDITSVDIQEGVTSIGSWAFSQCSALTDVSIAESVTSIGGDAFRECSILEEITLPKGLTELGTGVFLYCSALKSVTVPEGVTKIGSDTFEFCPQLSSITFPSGLTEIGAWALKGAYNLTSITCKAATPPSLEREVFSGVNTETPIYVPASSVEAYKTAYGWNQFANIQPIILASGTCGDDLTWKLTDEGELTIEGTGAMTSAPWRDYTESIKVITIKEGVTTICDRAFEGCNQVETMIIPNSVVEVGTSAFNDCTGELFLNSMPVPAEGSMMMGGAFESCGFTKVIVGEGVTEIKDMAFFYSRNLAEVELPETIERIGDMAFAYCHSLTSITIPASVTTIDSYAFDNCVNFTTFVCKGMTPPTCIGELFYNVNKELTLFVPITAIANYQVAAQWKDFDYIVGTAMCGENLTGELWPDGKLIVKGEGAITTAPWEAYGEQVKEVVLEEGVTGIADGAFADLENLASITSYAIVPPVCGVNAFASIENTTPVYVPADEVEAYGAAEGWKAFTYLSSMNSRVLLDTYATYAHAEDEEFDKITYVRNFTSKNWEALYLPFEIGYEDICEDFDVAYIYDTHQYDTDDDGVKDETVIEIFKIKEGTLEANYPYLIRAKEAGKKEIVVNDATLYATEEVTLDCSSIFDTYTFTTTYSSIPAGGFEQGKGYYTLVDGMWLPASKYTELGAFRFYLKVDSRSGAPAAEARSIRMRIVGEDNEGGTTDIENSEITIQNSGTIFDLSGRRLTHPTKGINIIQMTDGSVRKMMAK